MAVTNRREVRVTAVVLRAHLYNPPPKVQELFRLLDQRPWSNTDSDVRSPVRKSDRTLPLQKQTKLTEREIRDLIRDYQSGATIKALAETYRIHRTTVYEHLDRNTVPRRQRGLTPEQIKLAIQLYEHGLSLAKIGRRFNVDAQTVRDRIAEEGVQIRKRRGW